MKREPKKGVAVLGFDTKGGHYLAIVLPTPLNGEFLPPPLQGP